MFKVALGEKAYRDYGGVVSRVRPAADRLATEQHVIDALWPALEGRGVSWVGFYHKVAGRDEMLLDACRPKPACSPLGLQGMCGRCWRERRPILLHDSRTLPPDGYIGCDPKDLSEVVVPLFEPDGSCWGVLDLDSYEVGSFSEADVAGLTRVVERAGLSAVQVPGLAVLRL